MSDTQKVKTVRGAKPAPTLERAAADYAAARGESTRTRDVLKALVRQEAAKGVPQTQLAVSAGVDRLTVREWLGLGRMARRV